MRSSRPATMMRRAPFSFAHASNARRRWAPYPLDDGDGVPSGFEGGWLAREVMRRDDSAEARRDRVARGEIDAVFIANMGDSKASQRMRADFASSLLVVKAEAQLNKSRDVVKAWRAVQSARSWRKPLLRAERSEQRIDCVRRFRRCWIERNAGNRVALNEFDALEEVPILLIELARGGVDNVRAQRCVSGCVSPCYRAPEGERR